MVFKNATTIIELHSMFQLVKNLNNQYPNFYDWYWNKVVPNVLLNNDEVIMAFKKNEIVGLSIIKKEIPKLSAVRILEQYKNKGYGLDLIDESLKRLNVDKPLCSVSEEMIHDYSRLFIK